MEETGEFLVGSTDAEKSTPHQLWRSIDALTGRGHVPTSAPNYSIVTSMTIWRVFTPLWPMLHHRRSFSWISSAVLFSQ